MTKLISLIDLLILVCLYFFFILPKLQLKSRRERTIGTLFYIYLCIVFALTLVPIIPTYDAPSINLIPFRDCLFQFGDYARQIILNILLFVPLGIFLPYFTKKNFIKTVTYCAVISLFIETAQPWITLYRVCDITDLITNTLGAALGYNIYAIYKKITTKKKD